VDQFAGRGALADILTALRAAPRHVNPAVALERELERAEHLTLEQIFALQPRLEHAVERGAEEARVVADALRALRAARAVPTPETPDGF
jgi:hypothetical protein